MLVLSRKNGERLLIGKDVILTVLRITASHVRLGIEAPADLEVYREEICLEVGFDPQQRRRIEGTHIDLPIAEAACAEGVLPCE